MRDAYYDTMHCILISHKNSFYTIQCVHRCTVTRRTI